MTNPFPFTAGDVLNAADLNAISAETAFTPDWQNGVTVGNATQSAFYYEINDLIVVSVNFALGSTSAITGDIRMGLPVNGKSSFEAPASLSGFAYDQSTAQYWKLAGSAFNTTALRIRYLAQSGASPQGNYARAISATQPITFTTSDRIVFTLTYPR